MEKENQITVLGCGRWASFHAWYQAVPLKHDVLMWGRRGDAMFDDLAKTRRNDFLELPGNISLGSDLEEDIAFSNYILIVISAQGMRDLSPKIAKIMAGQDEHRTFILCMKGIDEESYQTLAQLLRAEFDKENVQNASICVWLGPGHIQEFLDGQPGVMLIDGEDEDSVRRVVEKFRSSIMRLYMGEDLVGAEVGAAAKNVLGIAAGILDGVEMPSLKGALMARGVHEVAKLIVAMGGKRQTAYGLSHLGDFEATLFSRNSNNRKFGESIIKYLKESDKKGSSVVDENGTLKEGLEHLRLAEGVATSKAMYELAKKHGVEMPITNLIYEVLHQGKDPFDGFKELFFRGNNKEFNF